MLYFKLLKQLSFLFFLLFVLSLPCLLIHIYGDSDVYQQYSWFEKASLGNDGQADSIYGYDKKNIGIILMGCDFIYSCVYLIGIYFIKRSHWKICSIYNHQNLSISRFTVMITNIPPNLTKNDVTKFFEQYGNIISVVICYNDHHILQLYIHRNELKKQLAATAATAATADTTDTTATADTKQTKLQQQLSELDIEIQNSGNKFKLIFFQFASKL
jgi:hypothetical protein